jgi:NADH-quinone oxidoreductase subunit J
VAIVSTVLAITRLVAVHALLYLIVSLLAVAVVFYTMGAPLVAALEMIIYAGAIVVLFVFVVMMLNLGAQARDRERQWLSGNIWIGPAVLSAILLAEVIYLIVRAGLSGAMSGVVGPKQVAIALYGPYLIGVELASMLLLGALVGASHLGRPAPRKTEAR